MPATRTNPVEGGDVSAHIGIVGCSAEGAALCYRTICLEGAGFFGAHGHPEVSVHTFSLAGYVERIERGDWRGVGELMLASAEKLRAAGADFLVCPDNTIHQAFPFVETKSPLPWLHIVDVVAEHAREHGLHCLGIMGTRWLVDSGVYRERMRCHALRCLPPAAADLDEIHRIIMEELVRGVLRPEAVAYFQGVMEGMKEGGCDGVVLGCTEIPLLMSDDNSPLPALDSTRLLARAALVRAAGSPSGPEPR